MNYFRLALPIFFIFYFSIAHAGVKLKIGLVHKKGIDKNFVLVSELYSIEEVHEYETTKIKVENGVTLELKVEFFDDSSVYGPSSILGIELKIIDQFGKLIKSYKNKELVLKINEEKKIKIRHDSQLIELSITPNAI